MQHLAAGHAHADDPVPLDDHALRTGRRAHLAAGALDRLGQRGGQHAWIDRMVPGDIDREADRRSERGLGAARAAGQHALRLQAEGLLQDVQPLEHLGVVPSRATTSVPVRCSPGSQPEASASSAQNASKRAAPSSPSRSSASSPKSASVTGASIPAATCHAPGSPASSTVTPRPRCSARQAMARPMVPPPTMTTPFLPMPLLPYAGMTRIRFDGRRSASALSALTGSRS